MRFAPLLLLALLVFPVISQVYAWDIERCYGHSLWILQRIENSHTDGKPDSGFKHGMHSGVVPIGDMSVTTVAGSPEL